MTFGLGIRARSSGGGAVIQAQVDAAVAANPTIATDTEVDTKLATKADQTALDALVANNATQGELDAVELKIDNHIASHPDVKLQSVVRNADNSLTLTMSDTTVINVGAATASAETDPVYIADKPTIDAHIADTDLHLDAAERALLHDGATQDAAIALKQDALPTEALKFYRGNAAGDGIEQVDLDVSAANYVVGLGRPEDAGASAAGQAPNGYYYKELDATNGANDIWGPKEGGEWPGQADGKSYDELEGAVSDVGDAVQGPLNKLWAADRIKEIGDKLTNGFFRAVTNADYPAGFQYKDIATNDVIGLNNIGPDGVSIVVADAPGLTVRYSTVGGIAPAATVTNETTFTLTPDACAAISRRENGEIDVLYFGRTQPHYMRGDNGASLYGSNLYFLDETVGAAPGLPQNGLGAEYAVGVIQANKADWDGTQKVVWTHYITAQRDGTGIAWVEAEGVDGSVPTRFYDKTTPGTSDVISDEDQYAILNADGEYTMAAQTAGRRIHIAKTMAGVATVRGTGAGNLAEFTSDQGTSADQILTINRQLEFATAVGSAAGPWSIFEGVTDGTGSGAYRVQGSVHIMEFDNGFVRQWGRTTGASSTFVVPYKDAAALDVQTTVNNSSVRYVHVAGVTTTRVDFAREGGTGAEVMWSVFGEKA